MPAQNGAGVVLTYGPQGARQAGGAIVLDTVPPRVRRTLTASIAAPWRDGQAAALTIVAEIAPAREQRAGVAASWTPPAPIAAADRAPWVVTRATDRATVAPWLPYGGRAQANTAAAWPLSLALERAAAAPWGSYSAHIGLEAAAPWLRALAVLQQALAPWAATVRHADRAHVAPFKGSRTRDAWLRAPWSRVGRLVRPRWDVVIPVHDGPPEALYIVPVRRIYMQLNAASLRRASDGAPVRAFGLNVSLDRDSWAWAWNASIPMADQALVESADGSPVELEASINGTTIRLLAERIGRDRSFASARVAVSGRSRSAVLDAPYTPARNFTNTADRTLQQLMADVLTDNGVPIGWDLDFRPEDWLVPAGVFAHTGSYISAINRLAEAAGAYVQPHPTADTLQILPAYPAMPWEWATLEPDYELPSALMVREAIEWQEKATYNRVYVTGQQAGNLAQVTRAGTAGDLVAPTIVDALATAAAGARQRARPVLADVGRQALVTLSFPVLSETGLVRPGALVRYVDGATTRLGLARSLAVSVGIGERESKIRQTVQLETHL